MLHILCIQSLHGPCPKRTLHRTSSNQTWRAHSQLKTILGIRLASPLQDNSFILYSFAVHGTVGPNGRNLPKIRLKNSWNWLVIVMLATVWQILNMNGHAMSGIGNYMNLLTLAWKISWNHKKVNLFSVGFSDLKPLCMVPIALQKYLTTPT